ncbi:glutathione S-transferase N-terminal domain-containing protein [Gammaproteobacteria bacterium]|nr:glutathione S-transferase N-terminal domain-containing protein [Gammaproteobacteria bacterium]
MHLYTYSASPNGKRVAVFMKEKGIEIPATEIDIMAGENLVDEFRAKNPMARIPVLELDSGFMLAESVAISRFLEGLHPEPNLFGTDSEEEAVIEMWNRRAEINIFSG